VFAKGKRMDVVDSLRGFAILAIILLHNLEHFDFYYQPANFPTWLTTLDGAIWKGLFFLFAGKSYSIFALLFGLTFYIMFSNQQQKGFDFRLRFLWRMFILLVFGAINSLFYQGDILMIYAVLGISLVIVCRWSNKVVLITAILLLLQPFEWLKIIQIIMDSAYIAPEPLSHKYFGIAYTYLGENSFWDTISGNIWNGRKAVILWSYEAGRFLQTPALFMIGMVMGRKALFEMSAQNAAFWKRIFFVALATVIAFSISKLVISETLQREVIKGRLDMIVTSWQNFAFTFVWVSLFVLLFQKRTINKALKRLQPFGRMSLTNYVMQSILGSSLYYGFGFGLYKYTGATFSFLVAIGLFLFQLNFSRWWMNKHTHRPLEGIWHRLTWIKV